MELLANISLVKWIEREHLEKFKPGDLHHYVYTLDITGKSYTVGWVLIASIH